MDLHQRIQAIIHQKNLIEIGSTVVVGVSGGPDSCALFHILCNLDLKLNVVAVYVDHGLRPHETPKEIKLVQELASGLGSASEIVTVDVSSQKKSAKTSTEETARILRYEALEKIRRKYQAQAICVGHTADDQEEELLIRLLRGSGRASLSGMKMKNGHIIRPLLSVPKKVLIDYLEKHEIGYCNDSSNMDRSYLRNRIRHDLLPYLETNYNPSIRQTLLQTTTILNDEEALLERLAREAFGVVVSFDHEAEEFDPTCPKMARLQLETFQACHKALQRRILEMLCIRMKARPNFKLIEQLIALVNNDRESCEAHLERGLRAIKERNHLTFSHPLGLVSFRGKGVEVTDINTDIKGDGEYRFQALRRTLVISRQTCQPRHLPSTTLILDGGQVTFPLLLRSVQNGDAFKPLGGPGRKKVNRFLSDKKIPRNERPLHPVLCSNHQIVAIAGLQIDDTFRTNETTKEFLLIDWKRTDPLKD